MPEDERHRLLYEWSGSGHVGIATTVPELLEKQVKRTPDAVAVTCNDVDLSYAELNARANRLARLLINHGAGPERFVALAEVGLVQTARLM
jgi:non-ribosomal peptide synthetase component F